MQERPQSDEKILNNEQDNNNNNNNQQVESAQAQEGKSDLDLNSDPDLDSEMTKSGRVSPSSLSSSSLSSSSSSPSKLVDQTLQSFQLSDDSLKQIKWHISKELELGLRDEDNAAVKMLITYVREMSRGDEVGSYLALDLGGTHFRVLLVSLAEGAAEPKVTAVVHDIPEQLLVTQTGSDLFDYIASKLLEFVKQYKLKRRRISLGFTFSFPCKQYGLTQSILVSWTKGFNVGGVVGTDVVKQLKDALKRQLAGRVEAYIDVVAVINDTTGTLVACANKNRDCRIGLIVGTGFNACYMERLDRCEKWPANYTHPKQVIVNCEWGAMGDHKDRRQLDKFRNDFDRQIDAESLNPKAQTYEKMVGGMYVGELLRLSILKLYQRKRLFHQAETAALKSTSSQSKRASSKGSSSSSSSPANSSSSSSSSTATKSNRSNKSNPSSASRSHKSTTGQANEINEKQQSSTSNTTTTNTTTSSNTSTKKSTAALPANKSKSSIGSSVSEGQIMSPPASPAPATATSASNTSHTTTTTTTTTTATTNTSDSSSSSTSSSSLMKTTSSGQPKQTDQAEGETRLRVKNILNGQHLSMLAQDELSGRLDECAKIMNLLNIKRFSQNDMRIVIKLASVIVNRCAHLAASGISALLERIQRPSTVIGYDGSLIRYHPYLLKRLIEKTGHLTPAEYRFEFVQSSDGSGIGAAHVAAALHKERRPLYILKPGKLYEMHFAKTPQSQLSLEASVKTEPAPATTTTTKNDSLSSNKQQQ